MLEAVKRQGHVTETASDACQLFYASFLAHQPSAAAWRKDTDSGQATAQEGMTCMAEPSLDVSGLCCSHLLHQCLALDLSYLEALTVMSILVTPCLVTVVKVMLRATQVQ